MSDDELDTGLQFEVLAAALRADSKESLQQLEHLATMLEGALPDHCIVRRSGGLLTKKHVEELEVRFDKNHLFVKRDGARLTAQDRQIVRGVVLKSTGIDFDEWINRLAAELTRLAEHNSKAKEALNTLLTR